MGIPAERALERERRGQRDLVAPRLRRQLHADRQPVGRRPAAHRRRRPARQVLRRRVARRVRRPRRARGAGAREDGGEDQVERLPKRAASPRGTRPSAAAGRRRSPRRRRTPRPRSVSACPPPGGAASLDARARVGERARRRARRRARCRRRAARSRRRRAPRRAARARRRRPQRHRRRRRRRAAGRRSPTAPARHRRPSARAARSGCAGRAAGPSGPRSSMTPVIGTRPAVGFKRGEPAEVRGQPHARAGVGAEPERRAPGGDRRRLAAARPARGARQRRTGCWCARRPRCRSRSRRPTAGRLVLPTRIAPAARSRATDGRVRVRDARRAARARPATSGSRATAMLSLTVNGTPRQRPGRARARRSPPSARRVNALTSVERGHVRRRRPRAPRPHRDAISAASSVAGLWTSSTGRP